MTLRLTPIRMSSVYGLLLIKEWEAVERSQDLHSGTWGALLPGGYGEQLAISLTYLHFIP